MRCSQISSSCWRSGKWGRWGGEYMREGKGEVTLGRWGAAGEQLLALERVGMEGRGVGWKSQGVGQSALRGTEL